MTIRLLIAEDEAIIRMDHCEELARLGYVIVDAVGDGASAVARARELRPDLVIMCIVMPEMDGLTAAEMLTRERIAPVMIVSALSDDEIIERARGAGVVMYVTKPWREADMKPSIEMALARYGELQAAEHNVASLEDQLATRGVAERAAALLMQQLGLTQPEAFRRMSRLAMNHRRSLREVAEAILLASDLQ
jgi:response regulator NasT